MRSHCRGESFSIDWDVRIHGLGSLKTSLLTQIGKIYMQSLASVGLDMTSCHFHTVFCDFVIQNLSCGFLYNVSIHHFQESTDLDDYLWNYCGILLQFLPMRYPELNPIELLWNILVQQLNRQLWTTYASSCSCGRDADESIHTQ